MTGQRPPPTSAREVRRQSLPRRNLSRQEAALYCGIGEKLFARLIKMNRAPRPKLISTGRTTLERWDLQQLDEFIDRLPSRGDIAGVPGAAPRRLFNL